MTAPINTNDDFDDELLSAYVDDELTAAERALVEERLRVDPQARQMVEELRLLSGAIRSLPRETLGRDLRASIEAEALQAKADAKADDDRNILPISGRERWANYRRGLVWSAITIAAALMLMMVQPKDVDEGVRDVAKADREEELKEFEESRKNRRGRGADGALPPQGEMRALGVPAEPAKPITTEGAQATASAGASGVASSNAPAAPASSASPADALAEAPQRRLDELESLSKLESAAEPSPPPPFSEAAALGTLADEGRLQEGYAFKAMPLGGAAGVGQSAPSGDLAADKSKDQPAAAEPAQPATIELTMTAPNGVARFEKLLRQHSIQLGPEPAAVDAKINAKQLDEEIGNRLGGETFSRAIEAAPAESDRGAKAGADDADDGADVDVLVEASPEQIDALLRSCQSDKESFAEVSVPESMARNEATKLKMDRNAGRAQRYAADRPPAKEEEAATAEKKLAADALPQVAGGPAQTAAAGGAGGGGRQRGIGGARAWLLLPAQGGPQQGGGGALYWEDESPPTAAPPAGHVRVLFRLRPLPLPAAPPAAQPAEAKP